MVASVHSEVTVLVAATTSQLTMHVCKRFKVHCALCIVQLKDGVIYYQTSYKYSTTIQLDYYASILTADRCYTSSVCTCYTAIVTMAEYSYRVACDANVCD
jgi:hypothetical protein